MSDWDSCSKQATTNYTGFAIATIGDHTETAQHLCGIVTGNYTFIKSPVSFPRVVEPPRAGLIISHIGHHALCKM